MNLALEIVLIGLCFSISYSSPVSNSSSDAVHDLKPTEAPKSLPDHIKVSTLPPSLQSNATVQPSQLSQSVTSVNVTNTKSSIRDEHVEAEVKRKSPLVIGNKDATATDTKNTTSANSTAAVIPKQQNTTSTNNSTQAPILPTTVTQSNITATTAKTSTSTAAPVTSVADHVAPAPTAQERQFDGPSFVGGIVLTVGLTVIGFIAFKFYKSGNMERNYRTL